MGNLVWRQAGKDDIGRLCRCWNDELYHFGIIDRLLFKPGTEEIITATVCIYEAREDAKSKTLERFGFCEVQDIAPDELQHGGGGWCGADARAIRRFYKLNLLQISELMLTSVSTLSSLERGEERWTASQVNDFNAAIRKLTEGRS